MIKIKSLKFLLKQHGLEIFDAYYTDIHSGSIIAKVCKENSKLNKKTKRFWFFGDSDNQSICH